MQLKQVLPPTLKNYKKTRLSKSIKVRKAERKMDLPG